MARHEDDSIPMTFPFILTLILCGGAYLASIALGIK